MRYKYTFPREACISYEDTPLHEKIEKMSLSKQGAVQDAPDRVNLA